MLWNVSGNVIFKTFVGLVVYWSKKSIDSIRWFVTLFIREAVTNANGNIVTWQVNFKDHYTTSIIKRGESHFSLFISNSSKSVKFYWIIANICLSFAIHLFPYRNLLSSSSLTFPLVISLVSNEAVAYLKTSVPINFFSMLLTLFVGWIEKHRWCMRLSCKDLQHYCFSYEGAMPICANQSLIITSDDEKISLILLHIKSFIVCCVFF